MPYIVTNSDGSLTVTVPDSAVDTSSYSLALVGRSVSNYGQYFAQNTLRHLENFASAVAPSPGSTLEGQLWYNKTEEQLSVWEGSSWKRIGTVVGADNEKPTTYRSAGTTFYNTTSNKLEIWNDGWKDAGYGGLVTSAYSSDTNIQSPTTYGTRLRTLFLREAITNNMIPVIALVYVKSPQSSPTDPATNRGSTEVPAGSNNYETIMAMWSDFEFDINSNGTNTPVDGNIVDYYPELVPGTGDGILDARTGRVAGKVLKGQNSRGEYEASATNSFSTLYVTNSLGSAGERVPVGYFTEIDVSTSLTVAALTVNNNAGVGGDLSVTGNITSTGGSIEASDLVINNNSTLNGNTTINGNLTVNGVNTQDLGTDAQKIENGYFDNLDAQNLTVDGDTIMGNLTVNGEFSGTTSFTSSVDYAADTEWLGGANIIMNGGLIFGAATKIKTDNLSNENNTYYLTFVNDDTDNAAQEPAVSTNLVYNPQTNILQVTGGSMVASTFDGVATSAQYADLAEIYASDEQYDPGTVVMIGGSAEVTACRDVGCEQVFGVVSTDPAYLMNSAAEGVAVALQGRVPVKVQGIVAKGERLISAGNGVAKGIGVESYDPRKIIGRALSEKSTQDIELLECVIGVK